MILLLIHIYQHQIVIELMLKLIKKIKKTIRKEKYKTIIKVMLNQEKIVKNKEQEDKRHKYLQISIIQ